MNDFHFSLSIIFFTIISRTKVQCRDSPPTSRLKVHHPKPDLLTASPSRGLVHPVRLQPPVRGPWCRLPGNRGQTPSQRLSRHDPSDHLGPGVYCKHKTLWSLPSLGQLTVQERTNIRVFILHSYSQTRHCHFIVCTMERGRGGRNRARSSWTSGHYWSCGGQHMGSDQMNEWFTQKIFHTVMEHMLAAMFWSGGVSFLLLDNPNNYGSHGGSRDHGSLSFRHKIWARAPRQLVGSAEYWALIGWHFTIHCDLDRVKLVLMLSSSGSLSLPVMKEKLRWQILNKFVLSKVYTRQHRFK